MNSIHQNAELKQVTLISHGLGFACVIVTCLTIYFLLISPIQSEADLLAAKANEVNQFLHQADAIKHKNQELTKQVETQRKQWSELLKRIPDTAEESGFLSQITNLSKKNQLNISNFVPGPSRENETFKQKGIQLSLTGSYLDLCQFISELKTISRVTNIEHMTITSPNQVQSNENYQVAISFHLAYEFKDMKVAKK